MLSLTQCSQDLISPCDRYKKYKRGTLHSFTKYQGFEIPCVLRVHLYFHRKESAWLLDFIKWRVENGGSHAHAVCPQLSKFSRSSTSCRVFSVNVDQLEFPDGESALPPGHELRARVHEPL